MYPLARILERAEILYPERMAVIEGDVRLNYAALADRAKRLASALCALGLAAGDRVAILDRNSARFVETYFACAHAGLVLVPLNFRLAPAEIAYVLADSDARIVLTAPDLISLIEAAGVRPAHIVVLGEAPAAGTTAYEDLIARASAMTAPAAVDVHDIGLIYYTSGSTGVPKGVCLSHANSFAGSIDGLLSLNIGRDDVWLHAAPLFHLASAMLVWPLAMVGGCQVAAHFEPERALALMAAERVTMTAMPMTMIDMMAERGGAAGRDLGALRHLVYGGAPTPLALVERAHARFGPVLTHVYAMSECAGFATCLAAADHVFAGDGRHRLTSAGQPVALVDLRILDDRGQPVATGTIGEVAVSGPKVMRGYWNKPVETAAVMRAGWFLSGDLGYCDDEGYVFIVDRKKDMIISGGENVYPIEVETVLAAHPDVAEVAVIGVPDDRWGEAVMAVVVLRNGAITDAAALIAHCRKTLAGYKVPKAVAFRSDPLPTTGPGKIAKRDLRAPYWTGRERQI